MRLSYLIYCLYKLFRKEIICFFLCDLRDAKLHIISKPAIADLVSTVHEARDENEAWYLKLDELETFIEEVNRPEKKESEYVN